VTGSSESRTGLEDSPSGSGSHGLSESTAKAPSRRDGQRGAGEQKPSRRTKKKASAKALPEIPLDSPSDSADGASGAGGDGSAAQIRAQLYDRPDCLEDGLSIYTDAKAEPVGINFATEVGTIDLLARDDAGGLVVVLIAKEPLENETKSGKDLVSEALERVGWVRKHIAESQQEIRAIVLLDQVPDDISYSAAAVAATVSFKTYRMEISFSDVEV
jgi:hypothetical protein